MVSRKRKASQVHIKNKRTKTRASQPKDILRIESSDQGGAEVASGSKDSGDVIDDDVNPDSELQEILIQIKAQEENEREFSGASTSNNQSGRAPQKDDNTSPDEGLEPFRDLFTGSRQCTNCGRQVKSPRGCVIFDASVIPPSLTALLHAPCTSCRTNHCRGCFSPLSCPPSCSGSPKNSNCKILECCAEGRALAIFEALGGFDQQYIAEQSASHSRAAKMAKKAKKVSSVGPGGTGYGLDTSPYQSGTTHQPQASTTWEETIIHSVKVLIDLLPAPYSDNPKDFDLLPHPSIGHLVSLSQLPFVLGSLLRNDSVTDWISRKEMYNAMLSLLRRMSDCELTIRCLIGQRYEAVTSCGIKEWMWQTGDIVWSQDSSGKPEIIPPLYTHFKKLTKQSESFLAGAMSILGTEQDVEETVIQGVSLCGDIIATRDDLERAINILGETLSTTPETQVKRSSSRIAKSRKGKGRALEIELDKAFVETCERLAFKYVSLADDGLYASYHFRSKLETTEMSTRLPKDRLHLLKELAMISTSLPPGIWVRVDEVRNDAIKIMIAGPDRTPYAGGLFEFDCFLPLDYPNKSPRMHFRTTGGGRVNFNPNLYACGTVCLSLLGTWSGSPEEEWHPGRSTLLQVLISIQSMILNDLPYYNEPGHGRANSAAQASISYNKNIYAQTVKWAIVDWLKDGNQGIWRDVIASYFKINKDKIRARILEWCDANSAIRSSGDLAEFDNRMGVIESWED